MLKVGGRLFAIALILVQLPALARTFADPSQSDFANYFAPAHSLATRGHLEGLYDRDGFGRAMTSAGLVGLGSFVPHPPANALWLWPFARLDAAVAKALWTVVLIVSFAFSAWWLARFPGFDPWLALAVVVAPTLAIRNSLAFGQPYPILAALLVAGAWFLHLGRPGLAGFLLGLGVSFKPYALALGLLFVHRDRWPALAGFVCGALTPSLLLLVSTGPEPFVEFVTKVLPWMARAEIQDPFSPGWGSASALANRLLRFEPDLNPWPWIDAPLVARFLGSAMPAAILTLGVVCGRRFLSLGRPIDAVAVGTVASLAASPFVASYHLVLLFLPVAALMMRHEVGKRAACLLAWALVGSSGMNLFRSAEDLLTPLAYARFFILLAGVAAIGWPVLHRNLAAPAALVGTVVGALALLFSPRQETWPRVTPGPGYTAIRPYFCEDALRWWSPSADGRRLESRGGGIPCEPSVPRDPNGPRVLSRFTDGSWNLYLAPRPGSPEIPITKAEANEIDPVFSPDGCDVVFASDQGRGLGSLALYRLDASAFTGRCDRERLLGARP